MVGYSSWGRKKSDMAERLHFTSRALPTTEQQRHLPSSSKETVKHLPTMWETWVQSLGWEDLLEKEMATHFSILDRKMTWTEEPGRLQSMGSQRVGQD